MVAAGIAVMEAAAVENVAAVAVVATRVLVLVWAWLLA